MRLIILSLLFSCELWASSPPSVSGLPLPRFVCLRAKAVNMHVGPGKHYPIDWRYQRPQLPVEVIAEFDTWRLIKDPDGTQGWVHKALLSGRRYGFVTDKIRRLRKDPELDSQIIASVEPGVICKILECKNNWCKVEVDKHRGWISRKSLYGIYPNETKF